MPSYGNMMDRADGAAAAASQFSPLQPFFLGPVPPQPPSPSPPQPPQPQRSILEMLPDETMIPSLLVLFLASLSLTLTNALFNLFAQRDRSVTDTFRQWSRVLWMSRAAHIVEAPSSAEAHRLTHTRHIVAVSVQHTPLMSPVELYDSAAFFRGIAAPGADPEDPSFAIESLARAQTAGPASFMAGSQTVTVPAAEMAAVYQSENPSPPVPAPVVTEALTNTMEAVRLEIQRLIFRFHPYYIILCSIKACAMLLYIQYHFDSIDGGWRRLCVCGAANIFSGLLTSVWEYLNVILLPLDRDRAKTAAVKVDEGKKDSVFIVELLFRISSLELDDLPTVLTQGSSFVAFAAVLVPMLLVFCVRGLAQYCWVYVPLLLVYALVRHLYYRGAGAPPSSTARNANAVFGMTSEMVKAFLLKTFTFFVVLVTVQSAFLLGLAGAENASYDGALHYVKEHQVGLHRSNFASTFQKLCLLSQLFL
ncbi:hypothetical protein ABB37_09793 [Leptomonas pyrrhocoris]|uniref:Transmembrane protein n=1 Tax=Leptomonas pyrrhocoris TaxID=157538 RepID=A0A0N0DQL5_LEPPY|nr:hypothetical protein ABB37_09793 [Leptomonas pyrrhocoris]KPA73468.1 hypothetical protein ABB37_09793 [Leptomonas pyrrhocoris]|eukprot:XP_015651907.1 hypothetical protein ABB37_09793 [Leptomonas pyrrhocoris]